MSSSAHSWPGVVRRYAQFLPVTEATPVVTLLEGNTPLILCRALLRPSAGNSTFT
jgi:threonine synthase